MKKLSVLLILFLSITVYGKEVVPGPTIWYSISEKILKGSHHLMVTDADVMNHVKKKAPKVKVLKVSTKFHQKDAIVLPSDFNFMSPPVAKNVWFLPE
jgi:hypothetical protein